MLTPWDWLGILLIAALALRLLEPTFYRQYLSNLFILPLVGATRREVTNAAARAAEGLAFVEQRRDRATRAIPLVIVAAVCVAWLPFTVPGADEYPSVRITSVTEMEDEPGSWTLDYVSEDGKLKGDYSVYDYELTQPGPPTMDGAVVDAWVQPWPMGSGTVLALNVPHDPAFREPADSLDFLIAFLVFGGFAAVAMVASLIPTWTRGRLTRAATAFTTPIALGEIDVRLRSRKRSAGVLESPRAYPVDDETQRLVGEQEFKLTGAYFDTQVPMYLVAGIEEGAGLVHLALFDGVLHPLRHPVPVESLVTYCGGRMPTYDARSPWSQEFREQEPQKRRYPWVPGALMALTFAAFFLPISDREVVEIGAFLALSLIALIQRWPIFSRWPQVPESAQIPETPYWLQTPGGEADSYDVGMYVDLMTDIAATVSPANFAPAARTVELDASSSSAAESIMDALTRDRFNEEMSPGFEGEFRAALRELIFEEMDEARDGEPQELAKGEPVCPTVYKVPGDALSRSVTGPVRSFVGPSELYLRVPLEEWHGFWVLSETGAIYAPHHVGGAADPRGLLRVDADVDEVERIRRF